MSGPLISVNLTGLKEFRAEFRKLIERVSDPEKAMRACALFAVEQVQRYFIDPGLRRKDGLDWPRKSKRWSVWEGQGERGDKPLYFRGKLKASISGAGSKTGFAYGTNLKYAHIHNVGAENPQAITVHLRKMADGTERLVDPGEPDAIARKIQVQPRKRTFLDNPPERFVNNWQDILLKHFAGTPLGGAS